MSDENWDYELRTLAVLIASIEKMGGLIEHTNGNSLKYEWRKFHHPENAICLVGKRSIKVQLPMFVKIQKSLEKSLFVSTDVV